MSTDRKEILALAKRVESLDGTVSVKYDSKGYIDSVCVHYPGVGPHPMDPLSAAERMREIVARSGFFYCWPSGEFLPCH